MNILLIEPDRLLAKNYHEALELAGHKVNWQHDAQSAVHALDDFSAEAVILELQMPSHNGIEFLYEFRSYPEWQNIPVIVLSMVPEEALGEPGLMKKLGVEDYLYKPQAKLRRLVRTIEDLAQPVGK